MAIVNLTPHAIQVYSQDQFTNLEQINATTWVADGVEGDPVLDLPSEGVCRVKTETVPLGHLKGIPTVRTTYGAVEGIPGQSDDDDYIVSLVAQSAVKAMTELPAGLVKDQFYSPYKVVRSRKNGSIVLGCMGLTL